MLDREAIANRSKHWVRLVTACNNRCLFCLDMDTPRNVYLSEGDVKAEILRGREELDAWKVVLSGGEASVHPLFPEFIRYANEVGYGRVQTVTNGMRYAERDFFESVMDAGLGEITFSLHGHTAALHDHLVQCNGAFRRLIKGLIRALRDGRPIVNVDVVINKQNVGHIDKIVELAAALGVREFDLLHVIPQSEAFRNADQMFYDVREHLPRLQRVFKLNRRGFHIWTNRFPVAWLEGLEDLIQDPHKMLDEVNGRRFQLRRYLDQGDPLDCRQPERCRHCFIQPFCDAADDVVSAQNERRWAAWWVGEGPIGPAEVLPYGCEMVGVALPDVAALRALTPPVGAGLYLQLDDPAGLEAADLPAGARCVLIAATPAHLEAWLIEPPGGAELEIHLNRGTAAWLAARPEALADVGERAWLHQPTHEHMKGALAQDVDDPCSFFEALDGAGVTARVSGLPACLAPGATLIAPLMRLPRSIFDADTGRLDIRRLATLHVRERYRGKSVRCRDCRVNDRCPGLHINAIRARGLGQLTPVGVGRYGDIAEASLRAIHPAPPPSVNTGRPLQPPAPSLPGRPPPAQAPQDPLSQRDGWFKRSDFLSKTVLVDQGGGG